MNLIAKIKNTNLTNPIDLDKLFSKFILNVTFIKSDSQKNRNK